MRIRLIAPLRRGIRHGFFPPSIRNRKINRLLSFLLAIIMAVALAAVTPTVASAENIALSGECGANGGNVTWALASEGTLTVSGAGEMRDYQFFYYLGSNSPWSNSSIKALVVKEGVTSIGMGAFPYCAALSSIELPNSVTSIGQFAFCDCRNLKDIYYSGTEEEWDKISIGSSNEPLSNATIHYISTERDDEPVVDLDALLGTDPAVYNNELAEVAARLSLKTYDNDSKNAESVEGYLQYNLGFDKSNIHSRNYGSDYAFTIATKEYSGDDADEILVIVAQGTTTPGEKLKVYLSELDENNKKFYGGYEPYQVVSAFYAQIVSFDYRNPINLYSLTEQGTRYKILVTGHSLGGAAANLLAAQLTARRHIGKAIGQSDVFCYTFGAIDVIQVDSPIVEGYENIHNIYNEMDTLSPTQYGRSFIGKNGIMLRNGKFGVIEAFEHEYRTPEEKSNGDQVLAGVNHAMHNYLEAVKSHRVEYSPLRPGNAGFLDLVNSYSVVGCPVDVDVYCDGDLVGRVVNNCVDDSATSIKIWVDEDVKFIVFPDSKQYDLRITAFDEGCMVFYTQSLTGEMQVKTISNVALTEGKIMTSQIGGSIEVSDMKLFVVNDEGKVLSEVLENGMEIPVEHTPDRPEKPAEAASNAYLNDSIMDISSRCIDEFVRRVGAKTDYGDGGAANDLRRILNEYADQCSEYSHAAIFMGRGPDFADRTGPIRIDSILNYYSYLFVAKRSYSDSSFELWDILEPCISGSMLFPCPPDWTSDVNVVLGSPYSKSFMWITISKEDDALHANYVILEMNDNESILKYWIFLSAYETMLSMRDVLHYSPYGFWDRIGKFTNVISPEEAELRVTGNQSGPAFELFPYIPSQYIYWSGAGSWSTDITINFDGSFNGQYHNFDFADGSKGYEGILASAEFSGRFVDIQKISDDIYSARMVGLAYTREIGTEQLADIYNDGSRYLVVYTSAPGIEEDSTYYFYKKGALIDQLPQGFTRQVGQFVDFASVNGQLQLPVCGIYLAETEAAFYSSPYE